MKRLGPNTVELTSAEQKAYDEFNALLDEGLSIISATHAMRVAHPHLDEAFFDWLVS